MIGFFFCKNAYLMLDEFDTSFFLGIVDHVLARRDGTLTFVFKDGSKVDA